MVRVDLRSERAGGVEIDLIFDHCAVGGALNLPAALIELANGEWLAGAVVGSNPVHVLREIANLVQGIPHRQLQLTSRVPRGEHDLHVRQVLFWVRQRYGVSDGGRRVRGCIHRGERWDGDRPASCQR